MDDRLREKIRLLVGAGVRRLAEMRRHLNHYVENDLFAHQALPNKSDTRFWPGNKAVLNCTYREVVKLRYLINYVTARVFFNGRRAIQIGSRCLLAFFNRLKSIVL